MKYYLVFLIIYVFGLFTIKCNSQINNNSRQPINSIEFDYSSVNILKKINEAWQVSWDRFYHPKTNQFYDYLVSYEKGKELTHLPTAEEVANLYPNHNGYDTGMEDCMISAGIMLCMIIDKYYVTKDEKLKKYAYEVFKGIEKSTTAHDSKGFVARGVCVEDSKSIYIGSSRDQITHAVYGLWHYYHSPLSSSEIKNEIGEILSSIADRAEQNVVPSNNYNFLRADGTPDNLLKMWENDGHEVARLPMIYAAAWETTGELKYFDLYQKYIIEAVKESFIDVSKVNSWALLQMQSSFELLISIEKDPDLKMQMAKIMQMVSKEAEVRVRTANNNTSKYDLTMVATDWRDGGGIKWDSEYRHMWYSIREVGEAALMQLLDENHSFSKEQESLLFQTIAKIDYNKVSTSGIFYLQGAYWKGKHRELF